MYTCKNILRLRNYINQRYENLQVIDKQTRVSITTFRQKKLTKEIKKKTLRQSNIDTINAAL